MVIDDLEFSDVSMFHHDGEELDDDFGVGADQNLSLASLFSVVDTFKGIGQYAHSHHG